jgi:hypothetical protein
MIAPTSSFEVEKGDDEGMIPKMLKKKSEIREY